MGTQRNSECTLSKVIVARRSKARVRHRMEMQRAISVMIGVLVSLMPSAMHAQEHVAKRVLVLYSYDKNNAWNVGFEQTFESALKSTHGGPVEYYPEYL